MSKILTPEQFQRKSSVNPSLLAVDALQHWIRRSATDPTLVLTPGVSPALWFIEHCNYRVCFLYSTVEHWMDNLAHDMGGKKLAQLFIHKWAKEFMRNPDAYMAKHPHAELREGTASNALATI